MLANHQLALYNITHYYNTKVAERKQTIAKTIHSICKIVQDIFKEVETQEPRFISTVVENNGRYEGVHVISPTEFEIILYLNQMGVFNFVDDGSVPGHSVLKLSDGRKRSMSLWVEFITASGYLSARKIRSRFQALVAQAVEKSPYRDCVKVIPDTTEVKLRVQDKYVVQITCTFRCTGIWPRSATPWPMNTQNANWPPPNIVAEVKTTGFDLLSRESNSWNAPKQPNNSATSMEGDAWAMYFTQAEDILLEHGCRRRALSILKTLRDSHLDFPNSPITVYILKTIVLLECEKHPNEPQWGELELGDRIIGVLLQLVSCLQCRRCPHYFIPTLDLLRGKPTSVLDQAAKTTWRLVRDLIINPRSLEML